MARPAAGPRTAEGTSTTSDVETFSPRSAATAFASMIPMAERAYTEKSRKRLATIGSASPSALPAHGHAVLGQALGGAPEEAAAVRHEAEQEPAPRRVDGVDLRRRRRERLACAREADGKVDRHGDHEAEGPRGARAEHLLREEIEQHDPDLGGELGRHPEGHVDLSDELAEPGRDARGEADDDGDQQRPRSQEELRPAAGLAGQEQHARAHDEGGGHVEQDAELDQDLHSALIDRTDGLPEAGRARAASRRSAVGGASRGGSSLKVEPRAPTMTAALARRRAWHSTARWLW